MLEAHLAKKDMKIAYLNSELLKPHLAAKKNGEKTG